MDLDSLFQKVLLYQSKTGAVERREIKQCKRIGEKIEVEKATEGVLVIPVKDILLIIPVIPKEDFLCSPQEVDAAIRFLEGVPAPLAQQAGVDGNTLEAWRKLKERAAVDEAQKKGKEDKDKKTKEAEEKSKRDQEVRAWLVQASEFRLVRSEKDLKELRETGEVLARQPSEQSSDILDALVFLSQVQPKEKGEALPDLSQLNEIKAKVVPDDLLGWLTGGCLFLSFFLLLFGMGFLSSSLTRFKEGAFMGGVVFGFCSVFLLGALGWTWWPIPSTGSRIEPNTNANMEELVLYIKNRIKPAYYFPKKTFTISVDEWRSAILSWLPPSEESTGLFKAKMGHVSLFTENGQWSLRQPMTALGIPLPITFTFQGNTPELKNWDKPAIEKIYLGHWPLPDFIRGMVAESAENIWQQGLSSIGLSGVPLGMADQGMIVVSMPAVGTKPKYELPQVVEEKKPVLSSETIKKKIAAEDLIKEIQLYQGRFVLLDGYVEDVDSGGEYSGDSKATEGFGGKVLADKPNGQIGMDRIDKFFLHGGLICLIKSKGVFTKDNARGDIYWGPRANTIQGEPIIKKGMRVRFMTEGRVEGRSVYGIRLDEASQIQCYDPQQEVKFSPLNPVLVGDADFDLKAEGQSGSDMPVTFISSDPSIVEIYKGNRAKIKKVGRVIITATQEGNSSWLKGTSSQELVVEPKK